MGGMENAFNMLTNTGIPTVPSHELESTDVVEAHAALSEGLLMGLDGTHIILGDNTDGHVVYPTFTTALPFKESANHNASTYTTVVFSGDGKVLLANYTGNISEGEIANLAVGMEMQADKDGILIGYNEMPKMYVTNLNLSIAKHREDLTNILTQTMANSWAAKQNPKNHARYLAERAIALDESIAELESQHADRLPTVAETNRVMGLKTAKDVILAAQKQILDDSPTFGMNN
jgi:hypothetical protein